MEIFKRFLAFIIIITLSVVTPINNAPNSVYAKTNGVKKPVKAAVFISTYSDEYLSLVKQNLEDIQKENKDKIQFTFFNANGSQEVQNESMDKALDQDYDFFVLVLVNAAVAPLEGILNKINAKNIPLIVYVDPTSAFINLIKPFNKTIIIGTYPKQAAELQGDIIINEWKKNQNFIDKNKDNVLQYVLLHGETFNTSAVERTKYVIETLNNAGIKTEELARRYCNWDRACAKTNMESLLLKYGNKIEAVISNNDAMAIGAIEALQNQGYFKGDKSTYIPVVGIDAIPEAKELIKKGLMTGTVTQDPRAAAEAIYTVGMNLVSNKYPLDGTSYKFDETGKVIRLPYLEYKKE